MELSICSVSFNSATELKRNIAISKFLNTETDLHWIIAENTPANTATPLSESVKDATVITGAGAGHSPTHHHTIALGKAIARATTRFILILDPDFFIVKNEWAAHMIRHMVSNKLSILGVPWHPKLLGKYRYFPAVHCSLFDTERFPQNNIDFRPDYPDGNSDPAWPGGYDPDQNYFAEKYISRLLSKLPFMKPRRQFYTDTGGRLFKRYIQDPAVSFELIDPIFDPSQYRRHFRWTTNLFEKLLPDELCYLPKHYRNMSDAGFLQRYVAESVPDDWQEFSWDGSPFGFHMQRTNNPNKRSREEELELLSRILEAVQRSTRSEEPRAFDNSALSQRLNVDA